MTTTGVRCVLQEQYKTASLSFGYSVCALVSVSISRLLEGCGSKEDSGRQPGVEKPFGLGIKAVA